MACFQRGQSSLCPSLTPSSRSFVSGSRRRKMTSQRRSRSLSRAPKPRRTRSVFMPSTRRKHAAYENTGCQDVGGVPIIGLPALLKLADWINQKRRESTHGGEACTSTGSDQIPPVPRQPSAESSVEPTLAGTASRDTAPSPAHSQSRHRTAAARANRRRGGGA